MKDVEKPIHESASDPKRRTFLSTLGAAALLGAVVKAEDLFSSASADSKTAGLEYDRRPAPAGELKATWWV